MNMYPGAQPGDLFEIGQPGQHRLFSFEGTKRDESLEFRDVTTGRRSRHGVDDFDRMRSDGRARRAPAAPRGGIEEFPDDVDPSSLADPEEPGITVRESRERLKSRQRLAEARVLRFWASRHDQAPSTGLGKKGIDRLFDQHAAEARALGFSWQPSDSALRRALEHGEFGNRPLAAFWRKRGKHDPALRWPASVLELKDEMIELFWGDRTKLIDQATDRFIDALAARNAQREAAGDTPIKIPGRETLRRWIRAETCHFNWARKFGLKEADAKFRGHGEAIKASRPLQYVVIDTTRVDNWSAIYDADGKRIIVERAFLTVAIDVRTRMILAIVLSFDPPSILTLMACVKRIVRFKAALFDRYGKFKGATDGFGRPSTIVLDNTWENVGLSILLALEAAGINVEYAPVRTPQYKAHVERLFNTLNTRLFHRLPSGIPEKPHVMAQLGLDPRAKAFRTIEWLEARIWDLVVTIYHVEKHEGIGMAPARAWIEQIKLRGRPTVDDPTVLDRFFGQAKKATLSASGVVVDGHRFHHGPTTTQLLDDLLRYDRQSRKKATGTVRVMVTIDQGDCSRVQVWNRRTRRHVMLPNVDAQFSRDLSWRDARLIREAAEEENQAFHSDAEKAFQRAKFDESLEDRMRTEKFGKARKKTRTHQNLQGARLVVGDEIAVGKTAPSVTGLDATEIASAVPAQERVGSSILPKGVRRGGKKAEAAAARTRKRKAEAAERARTQHPRSSPEAGPDPARTAPTGFSGRTYDGALSLEQSQAFMKSLAAKNKETRNGSC